VVAVAPPFDKAKVSDAMREGVFSCTPETSLVQLAGTLATHRIHCVVVGRFEHQEERESPWGIISDLDIVAAAARDDHERTAWSVARSALVTISPDDSLKQAAKLMAEREVSHLVVVRPESGHPVGVLSTLDIAGVLARSGTD
jgi:CBS domain-containing protein